MRGFPTSIRHRLVLAFAAVLLAALLQGGIGLWSTSRLAAARALAALARSNEAAATRFAEGASTLRRLAQWVTAAAIAITVTAAGVLAWPVVRRIVRMFKQAQDTTQALCAGQLSVHREVHGHDELAALLHDLHRMADRWHALVADVRRGAQGVAHASCEIAQGSGDLSQRTEQQAAYVQEARSLSLAVDASTQNSTTARSRTPHSPNSWRPRPPPWTPKHSDWCR
jgi:methyl-accepting chemotaxis protein